MQGIIGVGGTMVILITKYNSTLYIGMDEVLAHYACTFDDDYYQCYYYSDCAFGEQHILLSMVVSQSTVVLCI